MDLEVADIYSVLLLLLGVGIGVGIAGWRLIARAKRLAILWIGVTMIGVGAVFSLLLVIILLSDLWAR